MKRMPVRGSHRPAWLVQRPPARVPMIADVPMAEYDRRSFLARLVVLSVALPVGRRAHASPRRTPRIGFLSGGVASLNDAFTSELQRLGYVDGKNVVLAMRIHRTMADLVAQAAELASSDVDLVVAGALPQALEIRKNNPSMPMVIATCPGMVSNGFARSVERPGGIYTGMDELPPGVTAKRLQLLKTGVPSVYRVALLSTTPGRGGHELQLADAEAAAPKLGVTVKPYRATSSSELRSALANIAADGMDGMLNFQGGLSIGSSALISEFARKQRLPAMYQSALIVEAGGLMAWTPDQEEQYRVAARNAVRILRGARPGDIPIRFPSRYYLVINARAGADSGITLSAELLARADRVIR